MGADLDDEIDMLIKKRGLGEKPKSKANDDDELDDDELDDDEVDDVEPEPEPAWAGTWAEMLEDEAFAARAHEEQVLGYLAGFVAGTGSFAQATGSVRLTVRSTKNLDAVRIFADRAGCRYAEGLYGPKGNLKAGVLVQLSGKPLHKLMTNIWHLLPEDRKLEYARMRRKAQIYMESAG